MPNKKKWIHLHSASPDYINNFVVSVVHSKKQIMNADLVVVGQGAGPKATRYIYKSRTEHNGTMTTSEELDRIIEKSVWHTMDILYIKWRG